MMINNDKNNLFNGNLSPLKNQRNRRLFKELLKKKSRHVKTGILLQDNYLTEVVTLLTAFIETGFFLWSVSTFGCMLAGDDKLVKWAQILYLGMGVYSYIMFFFCLKYGKKLIERCALYEAILSGYYSVLILFGIVLSGIYQLEGASAYVLVLVFICTFGVIIMNPIRMVIASVLSYAVFNVFFLHLGINTWYHSLNILEIIFYMNIIGVVRYYTVCGYLETTEILAGYSSILERLSFKDELTVINNRNALRKNWPSFEKKTFSVAVLDIDDFKHYNDTYGHEMGDKVIKETANLLSFEFGSECSYRMGGDEFLVITEMVDDEFEKKIRDLMQRASQFKANDEFIGVTYSIGALKSYCKEPNYMRELIKKADTALYEVKQQGKNAFKYVTLE